MEGAVSEAQQIRSLMDAGPAAHGGGDEERISDPKVRSWSKDREVLQPKPKYSEGGVHRKQGRHRRTSWRSETWGKHEANFDPRTLHELLPV